MGLLPQKNENIHYLTFCSCQCGCESVDCLARAGSSVLQAKDTSMQDPAWPAGYSTWYLSGWSEEPRPIPDIFLLKSRSRHLFPKSRCSWEYIDKCPRKLIQLDPEAFQKLNKSSFFWDFLKAEWKILPGNFMGRQYHIFKCRKWRVCDSLIIFSVCGV